MQIRVWKDGKLVPGEASELSEQLRRYAGWADENFGHRSDPAGQLGERLEMAANAVAWMDGLLKGRDDFLVEKGMWLDFTASLPATDKAAS